MFIRDDGAIVLESAEEVAEFREMQDLAKRLRDKQRNRAEMVFNAFLAGKEPVDVDDRNDSASIAVNEWTKEMNRAIEQNLDHRSIFDFVELIAKDHVKALQVANAHKRHSENHAMKADIFVWLDANMPNFRSMDAAAQAVTKQQPIAFRTARGWVGEWKKVRSTGTP